MCKVNTNCLLCTFCGELLIGVNWIQCLDLTQTLGHCILDIVHILEQTLQWEIMLNSWTHFVFLNTGQFPGQISEQNGQTGYNCQLGG